LPVIQEAKEPESEKDRTPKKMHTKKKYILTINGKRFKFIHAFKSLGDVNLLKDKAISEENGIEVYTNTDFPAFPATRDPLFYATYNICEAIAEVMVSEKHEPLGNIFKLRDLILKQTGSIMRELDEEEKITREEAELVKQLEEKRKRLVQIKADTDMSEI